MAIYIGDQKIGKLYIGDVAIKEAYIGNELVYKTGSSAGWQTIWEGNYTVQATTTSSRTTKFSDAGTATKFRFTFYWYNVGDNIVDYSIPNHGSTDISGGITYEVEADVSTDRTQLGYKILDMHSKRSSSQYYEAYYTIAKNDNNFIVLGYNLIWPDRIPSATLNVTKIEALV